MTCFLVIWGLATATSVSSIVEFLIGLVGLGIAIDYSLLVIVRWREERAHGHPNDTAIIRAMNSAGARGACSAAPPSRSACSR